jgi:multicomponent Na+:H+ antiporter subunit C
VIALLAQSSPVPSSTGSLTLALLIAVLFATGTYLLLQRTLTRIVIGLALLSHGVNVLLLLAGGRSGSPPLLGDGDVGDYADPLPQAMALTAIVISFAILAFLLALAYRSWTLTQDDEVEDDVEDRRIARREYEPVETADPEALEAEPEDHP